MSIRCRLWVEFTECLKHSFLVNTTAPVTVYPKFLPSSYPSSAISQAHPQKWTHLYCCSWIWPPCYNWSVSSGKTQTTLYWSRSCPAPYHTSSAWQLLKLPALNKQMDGLASDGGRCCWAQILKGKSRQCAGRRFVMRWGWSCWLCGRVEKQGTWGSSERCRILDRLGHCMLLGPWSALWWRRFDCWVSSRSRPLVTVCSY